MGELIDLQKYKQASQLSNITTTNLTLNVVCLNNQPFCVVLVPFVMIFDHSLSAIVMSNLNNRYDFAILTANDLSKIRIYHWDSLTEIVNGVEYPLYPTANFNAIPDFGYLNIKYASFHSKNLGCMGKMSHVEFFQRYKTAVPQH